MPTKRKLSDLYVIGRDVVFDDGQGEPVAVYLKKLNSLETDECIRRANAARAKVKAARKDVMSEAYMDVVWKHAQTLDSPEEMKKLLIENKLASIAQAREAEVAAKDEWLKDGHLQGLMDAWETLKTHDLDEDAEAKAVLDELTKFRDEVNTVMASERAALERDFEGMPEDVLLDRALNIIFEQEATIGWSIEFRLSQVYLATKDGEDHKKLFFDNREEVNASAPEVVNRLLKEYTEIAVEVMEGKSLPVAPASSPSSELPGEAETSQSSGPQDVAA